MIRLIGSIFFAIFAALSHYWVHKTLLGGSTYKKTMGTAPTHEENTTRAPKIAIFQPDRATPAARRRVSSLKGAMNV